MDGNPMSAGSYDFIDLEDPVQNSDHQEKNPHLLQQGAMVHPQTQDARSFLVQHMQEQDPTSFFMDPSNGEMRRSLASNEDELNCGEEGADGDENAEAAGHGKNESFWHRVKWTDIMVKLLITAVSYVGEDCCEGLGGSRRKAVLFLKKGKWRSISEVMAKRGFLVSPQQCEDKFNDLNKRYKKLNEVLGRGTSCMVVENPRLLDSMNLSEKEKEEVRKILSSKQLFYEEMCSYHNGNRLSLPHDPDLQRSIHLALRSRDDLHYRNKEFDEEDGDAKADKQDDGTGIGDNVKFPEVSAKRLKRVDPPEEAWLGKCFNFLDLNRRLDDENDFINVDLEDNSPEAIKAEEMQKQWMAYRSLKLEEQKLLIKAQTLELEKQQLKWRKISWEQDRELEKMRLKNECMKLENERLALEIETKKLGADYI